MEKTQIQTDEVKENQKKKRKSQRIINFIVFPLIIVSFAATGIANLADPVIMRENSFVIHLHNVHVNAAVSLLTGGYEVRYDDMEAIELLHFNAWQLGQMIDDLYVPEFRRGRRTGVAMNSGDYRLHVSLDPHAPRLTIWITRRTGTPVLISFHDGEQTESLYKKLTEAVLSYQ